jgi:hypothetical protein
MYFNCARPFARAHSRGPVRARSCAVLLSQTGLTCLVQVTDIHDDSKGIIIMP